MHNDGYTLVEMLVCLWISTMLIGLSIPCIFDNILNDQLILSNYNYMHTKSIIDQESIELKDVHLLFRDSGLYFNDIGNINKAASLSFQNKRYIIRLGFGNLRVE